MIECIDWNRTAHFGKFPNPFMRGDGERPLRITLHSESLREITGQSMDAVALLRELGHLPQIELLETEPGNFSHIEVDAFDPKSDIINVRIVSRDGVIKTYAGINNPRQWPDIAAHLAGQHNPGHQKAREMLDVLIKSQAHYEIDGDILVTMSPLLLGNRDKNWVREANPRTPAEAAQIVGLFLRSRNNYTYRAGLNIKMSFNRGLFYWVLARHRLPNMWRYFSACVAASKTHGDDLQGTGEAILVRAVRALEARDAIGIQFYLPQNNETRDQMMYHFDYLTLVLSGALDAQARVANSVYQINKKERLIGFQREDFVKALKSGDAQALYNFVSSQRFKDIKTLLYNLRNTIHAAALKTMAYHESSRPEHSFVAVPAAIGNSVWEAAERLGSTDRWGLSKKHQWALLEPYSYSTSLVEESLSAIDTIASNTDVRRLFPNNNPTPDLKDTAPLNSEFIWGERLALLT